LDLKGIKGAKDIKRSVILEEIEKKKR